MYIDGMLAAPCADCSLYCIIAANCAALCHIRCCDLGTCYFKNGFFYEYVGICCRCTTSRRNVVCPYRECEFTCIRFVGAESPWK